MRRRRRKRRRTRGRRYPPPRRWLSQRRRRRLLLLLSRWRLRRRGRRIGRRCTADRKKPPLPRPWAAMCRRRRRRRRRHPKRPWRWTWTFRSRVPQLLHLPPRRRVKARRSLLLSADEQTSTVSEKTRRLAAAHLSLLSFVCRPARRVLARGRTFSVQIKDADAEVVSKSRAREACRVWLLSGSRHGPGVRVVHRSCGLAFGLQNVMNVMDGGTFVFGVGWGLTGCLVNAVSNLPSGEEEEGGGAHTS